MNVANRIALEPRFSGTYVAEQKKKKKKKKKNREREKRKKETVVRFDHPPSVRTPFIIVSVAYQYSRRVLLSQTATNRIDDERDESGN